MSAGRDHAGRFQPDAGATPQETAAAYNVKSSRPKVSPKEAGRLAGLGYRHAVQKAAKTANTTMAGHDLISEAHTVGKRAVSGGLKDKGATAHMNKILRKAARKA